MTIQSIPTSKKLTIFEGVDGSGKTVAAKRYADEICARYIHFGPFTRVTDGLARMYAEAMLLAVIGYQNVVFDRSWLSEGPYGLVMRGGRSSNPGRIKELRHTVARILTYLHQKARAATGKKGGKQGAGKTPAAANNGQDKAKANKAINTNSRFFISASPVANGLKTHPVI